MNARSARDRGRFAHAPTHLSGRGLATDYARALLESLGVPVEVTAGPDDVGPATAWARSGLMALTGLADGLPQMCPAPLASCADGAVRALGCIAPPGSAEKALPCGSALLGERAAIAGLHRNGAISAGGGCRLLEASDGWFAISITREADWSDVPAWLEQDGIGSWQAIAAVVASRRVEPLVERARLLGLAACVSAPPEQGAPRWCVARRHGPASSLARRRRPPRIVDLSSLWAGPLCSHLLQCVGARVVKVESRARPDGARGGPAAFYDLLNADKRSVALDFAADGLERLRELIDWADIVIEGSRPRALRQLGVIAEHCIARRSGLTWVSITGYGRDEPECQWAAFGDDAGVAAGLSSLLQQMSGLPLFCGDAIADPLTGMHAALAGLASHRGGGGRLLSIALRDVVGHCMAFAQPPEAAARHERWREWTAEARAQGLDATRPAARTAARPARALGADDDAPLAGWDDPC